MPMHMLINPRDNPEKLRYNPHRDFAWCAPDILMRAERILVEGKWPDLEALLDAGVVDPEDIEKGWVAIGNAINESKENFDDSMQDVLKKHGWFDINPAAHVAIMAVLGRICFGAMYNGIQETVNPDTEHALKASEMADRGAEFARLMAWPPWIRRLIVRWRAGK